MKIDIVKKVFSYITETVEGKFMREFMSKSLVDVKIRALISREEKTPKRRERTS